MHVTRTERERLWKAFLNYQKVLKEVEEKAQALCDFPISIDFMHSDSNFLVLNQETSNVAPLECLEGITRANKLTEEQHRKMCI